MEEEEKPDGRVPSWTSRIFSGQQSYSYTPLATARDSLPRFSLLPPLTPPSSITSIRSYVISLVALILLVLLGALHGAWHSLSYTGPPRPAAILGPLSPSSHSIPPVIPSIPTPQQYLANSSSVNIGTIPFLPSQYNALIPVQPLSPTSSISHLSLPCLDLWIARGEVCSELDGKWSKDGPVVDFVWTWVNGSDQHLAKWREDVAINSGMKPTSLQKVGKTASHFRDHDELRYSMRSVLSSFPSSTIGTLHLVVGDVPVETPESELDSDEDVHLAQVPQWADFSTIKFANGEAAKRKRGQGDGHRLMIHPHSSIFKKIRPENEEDDSPKSDEQIINEELAAEEWRDSVVPSFNSLAIESQLPNIPVLSQDVVVMNDDFFMLKPLSSSDVVSPLLGPLFRLQRDLLVGSEAPGQGKADPDGEWKGLGETNWLLDQRFGERRRPYLIHVARSISTPIWREVKDVFEDAVVETAESRFRGQTEMEVQQWFLTCHYMMEKHREALLWSFFFGKSDLDQDGQYSLSERARLLGNLASAASMDDPSIIVVPPPVRSTLSTLLSTYSFTGLPEPRESRLEFSSLDGFSLFDPDATYKKPVAWPSFAYPSESGANVTICSIEIDECFGPGWLASNEESIEKTFKRIAFENPRCGDCVIIALLNQAKTGLEAFLPPKSTMEVEGDLSIPVEAVGLSSTFDTASFHLPPTPSIRRRCIALIQRYAYTIGTSPSIFIGIRSDWHLKSAINKMMKSPFGLPGYLALNDDIARADAASAQGVDKTFKEWMESLLPEPTRWEVKTDTSDSAFV